MPSRHTMSVPVTTLVLVFVSEQLPAFEAIVATRIRDGMEPVEVRLADGEIAAVLDDSYALFGRKPVGAVVATEADALEAISLGADDAAVLSRIDEPTVVAFLDRVRLRARLRREQERLSEDVAHVEKLTALGTLVAGVGHELNNPLAAITLTVELLRDKVLEDLRGIALLKQCYSAEGPIDLEALRASLASVNADTSRIRHLFEEIGTATDIVAQLVRDLRVFSRSSSPEMLTAVDPIALIEQALRLVRRQVTAHGIIERDYPPVLSRIVAPRNRLTQVLTNLLVNAAHAIAEVERPVNTVRVSVRTDEQFMAISVSDTGPGIPEESLERIFDPFYTTKREGLGTGLGLAISRATLRHMGGDLVVTSVYGEGATFICLVPLPTPEALQTASSWAPRLDFPSEHTAALSVLLVDDDERVLRASARVLQGRHRVLIAHDGQEAIDLLVSGSHADVIVTELDIPERDGTELIAWLEAHHPELARCVVVATGARDRFHEFIQGRKLVVLTKPFGTEDLLSAVERASRG